MNEQEQIRESLASGKLKAIRCGSCKTLLLLVDTSVGEADGIVTCNNCGAHNAFLATQKTVEVTLG